MGLSNGPNTLFWLLGEMLHQTTNNLPQYMRPICQFIYFPFCFLSPRSSSPASGLRYAPPPNHTAEASPQRRPQLPTALPAASPPHHGAWRRCCGRGDLQWQRKSGCRPRWTGRCSTSCGSSSPHDALLGRVCGAVPGRGGQDAPIGGAAASSGHGDDGRHSFEGRWEFFFFLRPPKKRPY